MGKLIMCSGKVADNPYNFKMTDTNVYTIEEVCYYIRHNIYIMREEVFEKSFAEWLKVELGMEETSRKIKNLINDHRNLKDIVVTLCCSCDYYDEAEINELIKIMDETNNLPLHKRQKIKADNYIRCGYYEKAIEEYEHILKSNDMLNANIKEYSELYHNMGVAFALLDDIQRAALSFEHAYEKNPSVETLKQYIYALRLTGDKNNYEKAVKKIGVDMSVIKKIEKMYIETSNMVETSREIKRVRRLKDILKEGHTEEYNNNIEKYLYEWKEEYRKEISR